MVDPTAFRPGTPAAIEITDRYNTKYTSVFRGYRNGQYLILDHPLNAGHPVPLDDGTPCIVRFISEGNIIGFRSRILAAIRKPTPLVFLRFPQEVEMSPLRKSERYPVKLDAVLAGRPLTGLVDSYPRDTILNLSAGGCLIEAFEPQEKGKIVYLTVFLPEQGRLDDLDVEVKRCDPKGDRFHVGVAFPDLLDPRYEEIRSYLHTLEAYQVRA